MAFRRKRKEPWQALESIIPNAFCLKNLKANEKGIPEWEMLGYVSNTWQSSLPVTPK